jgi:hypothetical protein
MLYVEKTYVNQPRIYISSYTHDVFVCAHVFVNIILIQIYLYYMNLSSQMSLNTIRYMFH